MLNGRPYYPRIVELELRELLGALPAIALEGPRAVGKTETARRSATTIYELDDPSRTPAIEADPTRLTRGEPPILIDEWQRFPSSWDLVRRKVDRDPSPGQFILTGSAAPVEQPTHSGAGRIVTVRMRPMTLVEREVGVPTVSVAELLSGQRPPIEGETDVGLERYVHEIVASGFPGIRRLSGRARRAMLDGYIERVVERDFADIGHRIRNPAALKRWMRAYAAASSTAASYETIRDAATGGQGNKPARTTTIPYRDALERLWLVEPVPAWRPTDNPIARLGSPPKHQLADPALAARLLGADVATLIDGREPGSPTSRGGARLGLLFESLVTLGMRVFAQAAEASIGHLRTRGGQREVDLIVERADQRVLAVEVKLSHRANDRDVRHLKWLAQRLGDKLLDAVVVTTGTLAYRRKDGIAVVPAALLGP